jgi:putative DNA primase/helicase
VPATGWHENQFVFPDSSIGEANGESCFFQTEQTFNHHYAVRGTLQEWKDNVAILAEGNSRVAFSIAVALAPILMETCSIESGGFHHYGASSIGKSTTLDVAGSVWGGGGRNGFLTSWRATVNGLEGVAVTHNHACLCLDELGQAQPKDASEAAYMLANGSGKNRAGRTGSLRKPAEWALFFLSSGEITLADKLAEDSRRRRTSAGQEVRLVEIPAGASAEYVLFENIHQFPSSQAFANQLKKSARKYYGTAARAFIEAIAGFIDKHCPEGADFQTQRVSHRVGFVAACGELAIKIGILPWAPGAAATAAKTCFDAWIAARGGIEPAEIRHGIAAIRDFVSAHGNSRFMAAWETADDRTW